MHDKKQFGQRLQTIAPTFPHQALEGALVYFSLTCIHDTLLRLRYRKKVSQLPNEINSPKRSRIRQKFQAKTNPIGRFLICTQAKPSLKPFKCHANCTNAQFNNVIKRLGNVGILVALGCLILSVFHVSHIAANKHPQKRIVEEGGIWAGALSMGKLFGKIHFAHPIKYAWVGFISGIVGSVAGGIGGSVALGKFYDRYLSPRQKSPLRQIKSKAK